MRAILFLMVLGPLAVLATAHSASPAQQEYSGVLASTPSGERGAAQYEDSICHGRSGDGVPNGAIPIPVTRSQHYRVLARALVDFRRGRPRTRVGSP